MVCRAAITAGEQGVRGTFAAFCAFRFSPFFPPQINNKIRVELTFLR